MSGHLPVPVIDTNVIVAGLLTHQNESPVARILEGMLKGAFPFALSESLLAEYRAVLLRPKLCQLHKLSVSEIEMILTDLAQQAIVISPISTVPAPDAGDQLLWELLAARSSLVLVTGDKLLLKSQNFAGRVITPQAFCKKRFEVPPLS